MSYHAPKKIPTHTTHRCNYREAQLNTGQLASTEAKSQLQCASNDCQRSTDKDKYENQPFYTSDLLNKPVGT